LGRLETMGTKDGMGVDDRGPAGGADGSRRLTDENAAGIMTVESAMKRTIVFLVMIAFAAALGAQSLAEMARVEKARRISFAGRRGPVVTNATLLRVKIRPAVEIVVPEEEIVDLGEASELEEVLPAEPESDLPEASPSPAGEAEAVPGLEAEAAEPTLEDRLMATEELVDLLETKIAALNQDYSHQTNMVPNYVIEQQLTETLQRLQNAQADAVRLKREIDRVKREKRLAAAAIR
jgi:hypothetical protein